MATLRIERVLTLPGTLTASTMYIVQATDADLAEIYFSNSDGSAARHAITKQEVIDLISSLPIGEATNISVNASRDAVLTDNEQTLICDSTNAIDIIIRNDSATLWSKSEILVIFQKGTGVSRFVADSAGGVAFRGPVPDPGQYVTTAIYRVGPNEWAYI